MTAAIRLRLREARKARHFTQQQVADLMGITRDYYQKVEAGTRAVTLSFIDTFCRAVGASITEVVGDTGNGASLIDQWPEGYHILRRAAAGPAWQRQQLQQCFERVYGSRP